MKNKIILAALAVAAMAYTAAAKDVLKGVVTFSGDEYLIIAPDSHPNRSGTLVNLLQEDGTRAMGRKRFVPGERVTAEGEWVCKERSKREFSAAIIRSSSATRRSSPKTSR